MPAPRSLTIKNLVPSLPERGKIKIGMKGEARNAQGGGEYQLPVKLDHFVITTLERGQDGNFVRDAALETAILKETGQQKLTRIPVTLLYDDIELNFQSRYACFVGRQLWCAGDGQEAERLRQKNSGEDAPPVYERVKVACPCERIAPDFQATKRSPACKFNGNLSVIIRCAASIGGVWKFRTTSYNSVVGLMSSLAMIKRMTGGALAGIPLDMTVGPKSASDPAGKQQTVYIVGLEYRGTMEQLADAGYQIALSRAKSQQRIAHVEEEARRLLLGKPTDSVFPGEHPAEIAEEFYPDSANGQNGTAERVDPATGEVTTPTRPGSKLDALPSRSAPVQQQVQQTHQVQQQAQQEEPPDPIEELTGRRIDPSIGQRPQPTDDLAARAEAKLASCRTKEDLRGHWFGDEDVLAFRQANENSAGAMYDRHWKRVGNGNGERL